MRILFIGDVVGRAGRRAVREVLPLLKREEEIDFVVANGENAAGGIGITPEKAEELLSMGVDVITSGNHIWKKREILPYLDRHPRILRPANYPPGAPGRGSGVYTARDGTRVAVLNLEGRVFMRPLESPFRVSEQQIEILKGQTPIVIVDFHAEATSEKMAMGWFLDGEVTAVIGTHTHVQTSDERILPGGTAYITDAGMTGPVNSVIGMKKEIAIQGFLTQLPNRFEVAAGEVELQGVILEVEETTGRALEIRRVKRKPGG
ncbi:MAG TPA: TIGR00282 family metallophosphoesterase [Deltaproteobacteria bacterium]|nr:TIGR00282 family metallophosphoesterase [Deltaproteobacteria bacterium]